MMLKAGVMLLGWLVFSPLGLASGQPVDEVLALADQGHFTEALARFDVLQAQAASLAASERVRRIEELKIQHDIASLESGVVSLNLAKELQELRLLKETSFRLYLIAGMAAISLVGLLLMWKYLHIVKGNSLMLQRTEELSQAKSQLNTLEGLIPVCVKCNQIRQDDGYWARVDYFLRQHSGVLVSHGICPQCSQEHFPGLLDDSLEG